MELYLDGIVVNVPDLADWSTVKTVLFPANTSVIAVKGTDTGTDQAGIQRLLLRRHSSHQRQLEAGGLCSLELRRLRADLCLCYKIVHSKIHLDSFFSLVSAGSTRGHSLKIKAHAPRLDTKRYFFAYRISIVWNSLEEETVCSGTLSQFKVNLLSEDLSSMLQCF